MTELEHIEIEGFKGLESVEFEPSQINLITGRNNTGKTSLLESVELLTNPGKILDFGGDIDTLVNVSADKSKMVGRLPESSLRLTLYNPEIGAARDHFIKMVKGRIEESDNRVYVTRGSEMADKKIVAGEASEEAVDITSKYTDAFISSIIREFNRRDRKGVADELLILRNNGEEFPILYVGKNSSELLSNACKAAVSQAIEGMEINSSFQIGIENREGGIGMITYVLSDSIGDIVESNVRSDFPGVLEQESIVSPKIPGDTADLKFIDSIDLIEIPQLDEEDDNAIRMDDITDYVRENSLVDDLKNFTFDYLVFEKSDGAKYQIPYEFMGDGFKAIVGLLWELFDEDTENEIVLLEEPENHMHPGYIRQVVYFLIHLAREEDVQLFITTHNSDFINDFFNENLTEDQCEYLKEEFSLIRMEEDAAQVLDYETAESDLKDLHLDLRGI